ncbi:phage tail tape measure protein [Cytobacillus horneckiae]|uniref:phage tail tape measure protein n=1 Tax=Cytobacillus horneckiae TaxID=549687 RepID=UPI0034CE50B9
MGLVVRIGADIRNFEREMRRLTRDTQKIGDTLQGVGKTLTAAITLPLLALGGASVKSAMEFESAFASVRKTVDASEAEFKDMEMAIRNMAKEIPATTTEIAGVAEAAGQLGIEKKHLMDFTRTMVDMGVATNMTSEDAAMALAQFAAVTQMNQKNFDRLGATIVNLGNNFATTESDIVNMTQRLGAQGSLVGMAEHQIVGLSAAMSALGINAEAGGTAMTTVLKKIDSAVDSGGDKLEGFAKVSGMTSQEFKKAWEKDAAGALTKFIDGLSKSGEEGKNLTAILADLGMKGIYETDTVLRLAGAQGSLAKALGIAAEGWEENTALTDEASQRYETFESKLQIFKNKLNDIAISIGGPIMDALSDALDAMEPFLQKIGEMAQAFADMDKEQQQNILKWIGLAAAIGPALIGLGAVVKAAGAVVGAFKGFGAVTGITTWLTGLGGAAGTAGGALGGAGLAGALGAAATAAAPFVAGAALVAGAGYLIYKGLNEEAIPAVDLFREQAVIAADGTIEAFHKVSEGTQEVVGAFMNMNFEAGNEITSLWANTQVITDENAPLVTEKFKAMNDQIVEGFKKQKEDSITQTTEAFAGLNTVTAEEQAEILAMYDEHYKTQLDKQMERDQRVKEIMETARQEKRALTDAEHKELLSLQEQYQDAGVEALAANKIEQEVILNNLKNSKERINADMLSDAVKKMNEQRDKTVSAAEKERDERIRAAERMKEELGPAAEKTAQKMIDEANRQYKETVKSAEKQRDEGIKKLESAHSDLRDQVDTDTGEILTFWGKMKNWWNSWWPSKKTAKVEFSESGKKPGNNADGTANWRGGLTWINERGPELINLPKGSQVIPNPLSEIMMRSYGQNLARLQAANTNTVFVQNKQDSTPKEDSKPVKITNVITLDGYEIARNQSPYINAMQTDEFTLETYMKGVK